jgi:hypothetical protein
MRKRRRKKIICSSLSDIADVDVDSRTEVASAKEKKKARKEKKKTKKEAKKRKRSDDGTLEMHWNCC